MSRWNQEFGLSFTHGGNLERISNQGKDRLRDVGPNGRTRIEGDTRQIGGMGRSGIQEEPCGLESNVE